MTTNDDSANRKHWEIIASAYSERALLASKHNKEESRARGATLPATRSSQRRSRGDGASR